MLTETPAVLRPLWRLSAKLRLACGEDDVHLRYRLALSLPAEAVTAAGIGAELRALAQEIVAECAALPPERRPANYGQLKGR